VDACSGSDDEDEDVEAKAERLSERLRAADGGSPSAATGSPRQCRGRLTDRANAVTEAAAVRDEGAANGTEPVKGAQVKGRKASSGRITLFEGSAAVEPAGQRAIATQVTSAALSGVLADVRQHQASMADRDWLFGGADAGPGDAADAPASQMGKQAPKGSVARKGSRNSGEAAPNASTEHREFIRAKQFSGEPPQCCCGVHSFVKNLSAASNMLFMLLEKVLQTTGGCGHMMARQMMMAIGNKLSHVRPLSLRPAQHCRPQGGLRVQDGTARGRLLQGHSRCRWRAAACAASCRRHPSNSGRDDRSGRRRQRRGRQR
jgi:hypothetical protein